MKELSIEEKAQRYDEAIEKAKECHIDGLSLHQPVKDVLEYIFPELKESENERIRKAFVEYFKNCKADGDEDETWYGFSYDEILAWLEKQGKKGTNGNEREIPFSAWSEEDEQYLLVCKNALRKYQTSDKWDAEIISHWLENKLKSPQTAWKPTDEQMRELKNVFDCSTLSWDEDILESLYNDLKKLREE